MFEPPRPEGDPGRPRPGADPEPPSSSSPEGSGIPGPGIPESLAFWGVSTLLTLLLALWYLMARHAGEGWAWWGLPLDDTWIHLVYARSLATYGAPFYNPGVPEAGMSSPLWVLLLALAYRILTPLGWPPQWVAKGLSLLFALGVPPATYHAARTYGLSRRWAWAAGLLTALEANLAYGNVAGMEVPLFTLLTLLALIRLRQGRLLGAGTFAGLALVTRPEGGLNVLVLGLAGLLPLYLRRQEVALLTPEELRSGLKLFGPALLLGLPWAAYNWVVAGHPFPNTYYVKHTFGLGYLNLENLTQVWNGYVRHLAFFRGPLVGVALLLWLAAFLYAAQTRQGTALLPALLPALHLYAFSINVRVVAVETPWTYFTRRYLDVLIPLWLLALTMGAAALWELARRRRSRFLALTLPLLVLGSLVVLGAQELRLHGYLREQYSWNAANVERVNVAMGRWVGANLPPDALIAVTDAGALRFWSRPEQRILDLLGLNCAPCIGRPMEELIAEYRPDYLVVFRQALTGDFPYPYEELHSLRAERNTILGGDELVVVRILYEAAGSRP